MQVILSISFSTAIGLRVFKGLGGDPPQYFEGDFGS